MEQASVAAGARPRIATIESRAEYARAPFALRCGALLIDYSVVTGLLAFSTLVARMFGGGARSSVDTVGTIGYLLAGLMALLNFVALPALIGQTFGKWATGLRIRQMRGEKPGIVRVLLRHVVGYPLSLVLLGAGFLLAILDREGRALHDRVAGTVVVRDVARRGGDRPRQRVH